MRVFFEKEIEEYRRIPEKRDSAMIRNAVDYVCEDSKIGCTNEGVSGVLLALLVGIIKNTALALTDVITDFGLHSTYLQQLRVEVHRYIENGTRSRRNN